MPPRARGSAASPSPYSGPELEGEYCGLPGGPVRGRLKAANMHSGAFQRQLVARLGPVLQPIVDIFQAYARRGELSCSEPLLRNVCSPHQVISFELARLLANHHPEDLGGHRGLLFWHSTGSGKTILSASVMVAFHRTGHRVMLATTLANKKNNAPEVYAANMLRFFPGFINEVMGKPMRPTEDNAREVASKLFEVNGEGLHKPFVIITLEQFENEFKGQYQKYARLFERIEREQRMGGSDGTKLGAFNAGTCLIVDEAQNLWNRDERGQPAYGRVLAALADQKTVAGRGGAPMPFGSRPVKLFLLTATPGSTDRDWLRLLDLVRRTDQRPFTSLKPFSQFAGLVSHIDYRHPARFARVDEARAINVPVSPVYYAVMLAVFEKRRPEGEDASLKAVKQRGNFLTMSDVQALASGARADELARRLAATCEEIAVRGTRAFASPKLVEVVQRATTLEGKQYVYVQTERSALAIASLLEKRGYARVAASAVDSIPKVEALASSTAPRFVLYHAKEGERALDGWRALMKLSSNLRGSACKILVAYGPNYEGLDIYGLRGVHLVDPLFSAAADKQAIGRGARQCGHAGLSGRDLTVHVFRYFVEPPATVEVTDVLQQGGRAPPKSTLAKFERLATAARKINAEAAALSQLARALRLPATHRNASPQRKGPDYLSHAQALYSARRKEMMDTEGHIARWAIDAPLLAAEFGSGAGWVDYDTGHARAEGIENLARVMASMRLKNGPSPPTLYRPPPRRVPKAFDLGPALAAHRESARWRAVAKKARALRERPRGTRIVDDPRRRWLVARRARPLRASAPSRAIRLKRTVHGKRAPRSLPYDKVRYIT